MKTYEIKEEFYTLQKMLDHEEFDEATGEIINNDDELQQLLAEISDKRDDKADNIAYLLKDAVDSENTLKDEIARLTERKKMFIRQQEKLKHLLDFLLSGEKLKTEKFTFSYRTSQTVNITDIDAIPAKYLTHKEEFVPNKKLIKEALAEFEDVAGAEIIVKKSLGVR